MRIAVFAISNILALFLTCTSVSAQLSPELEAGYKAGFLCSGIFIAGRDPEEIAREELLSPDGSPISLVGVKIDRENRAVYVSYEGGNSPRLAVHHGEFGTVLLPPGATFAARASLPQVALPMPEGDPARIPWPNGDLVEEAPLPAEVDESALKRVIDEAFGGKSYAPSTTIGVVVVYRGQIIGEQYALGWDMHTQYRTWSAAKSLTNALVGIMVGEGKLKTTQLAPIPEWRNDPRSEITVDHLLHMSSGLKSLGSMTLNGYWGGIDTAADAVDSTLKETPGTRWKYSNYDTLLLMRCIKRVLGNTEAYLTLPRRALLNKIGMRHTYPEIDPYGNYILSSQVYTTPRDLARFGLLYLNDGVWNGERILPKGWVDYTVQPAPVEKSGGSGYGAQFWLYNADERVPPDTYSASGSRGQFSTIVPSRDVVVARMGLGPRTGSGWSQTKFVGAVLDAIDDVAK